MHYPSCICFFLSFYTTFVVLSTFNLWLLRKQQKLVTKYSIWVDITCLQDRVERKCKRIANKENITFKAKLLKSNRTILYIKLVPIRWPLWSMPTNQLLVIGPLKLFSTIFLSFISNLRFRLESNAFCTEFKDQYYLIEHTYYL